MTEEDILSIIKEDSLMMGVLERAEKLNLPNWVIGAGFVRNKVWNHLSGRDVGNINATDIDLVYYDQNGNDEKTDEKLSEEMRLKTGINWEIVNEYYAHKWNSIPPYMSTEDAISQWPETVTAIGVTIDEHNKLRLIAPYGVDDLVNFIVRPSPKFKGGIESIRERVVKKKWLEKWPNLTFDL